MVGITSGRCFAGNASLLGCCDVIIATANSNIGMGGPAMIEGGGLGVFAPEDIGPMSSPGAERRRRHRASRTRPRRSRSPSSTSPTSRDALPQWERADQRLLRQIVPENRLRVYDVREVIETLADTGSVLELRRELRRSA